MSDQPAEALVARAIESVLEAVPLVADEAPTGLEKYQPWADKAEPAGARGKRPLQAILDELAERVAAEPQARAATPPGAPPGVTFFDRFGGTVAGGGRSRRRSGRGRRGGERAAAADAGAAAAPVRGERSAAHGEPRRQPPAPTVPAQAGVPGAEGRARRRRGRRRGRRGGGGAPGAS